MTAEEVAESFVEAINSGEIGRMVGLMTLNHVFIDADGTEHVGRDRVESGWQEYFAMVPDFRIEVLERYSNGDRVVLVGMAEGTFVQNGELKPENHWKVPAAWRVIVESGFVAVWQLYVNPEPMQEILRRLRAPHS